ncbi:flagellar export chaperone FliS [Sanguibacter suaedae]|uniref:Flagellar export chaperone FliS n=1 Tax=Sanguibacter suaedae TaxID=2795737 RepID=A0A934MAT2_9MICO|nr:flagellar export chaperone FliS [Sanguibacter suaedae]MBI9114566.1 flagellar export chaperone FliS [Sanguibacter suaedae]
MTTNSDAQRSQFLNDTVLSASPARLLTMLYDRLMLDLDRAERAQRAEDHTEAAAQLTHAQDIVSELMVTLDEDVWDGATALMALYGHILNELIQANVTHDADRTASVRATVDPLRMAWHEAAAELASAAPAPQAAPATTGTGLLGVG